MFAECFEQWRILYNAAQEARTAARLLCYRDAERHEQWRDRYNSAQEDLREKRSNGTATADDYESLAVLADKSGNECTGANLRHNARLLFPLSSRASSLSQAAVSSDS